MMIGDCRMIGSRLHRVHTQVEWLGKQLYSAIGKKPSGEFCQLQPNQTMGNADKKEMKVRKMGFGSKNIHLKNISF